MNNAFDESPDLFETEEYNLRQYLVYKGPPTRDYYNSSVTAPSHANSSEANNANSSEAASTSSEPTLNHKPNLSEPAITHYTNSSEQDNNSSAAILPSPPTYTDPHVKPNQ